MIAHTLLPSLRFRLISGLEKTVMPCPAELANTAVTQPLGVALVNNVVCLLEADEPKVRSRHPRRRGRARIHCFRQWSMFRPSHVDRIGSPRFPGKPSHGISDVLRPQPTSQDLSSDGACSAALAERKTRASTIGIGRLISVTSPLAEYVPRRALPHTMQHSLPAGGLRPCRAGVKPAGWR